jgi:hypothetical protein
MAYFPDLSAYSYGRRAQPGVVHVGWLDRKHGYPKGKVPNGLLQKMKRMAAEPTEVYRGYHFCELCGPIARLRWSEKDRRSDAEIRVCSGGTTYAAPVLIVHYIEAHGYLPPLEFLKVLEEEPVTRPDAAARCGASSGQNMSTSSKINTVEEQRREMVRVARGILDGSIGIVVGARQLTGLRFSSQAEKDDDILVFIGIDSETDHLPVGDVRRHWNEGALKTKDEELQRYETHVKERAFRACENFIARHGGPS